MTDRLEHDGDIGWLLDQIDRLRRDMEIRDEGHDREAVRVQSERDAAESSRRDWAVEAMRLDVELQAALGGEARGRQECNELYEEVSNLRRELESVQQAYNRTFWRLYDIETESAVHEEGHP